MRAARNSIPGDTDPKILRKRIFIKRTLRQKPYRQPWGHAELRIQLYTSEVKTLFNRLFQVSFLLYPILFVLKPTIIKLKILVQVYLILPRPHPVLKTPLSDQTIPVKLKKERKQTQFLTHPSPLLTPVKSKEVKVNPNSTRTRIYTKTQILITTVSKQTLSRHTHTHTNR